jgi:4-hydroxythreonine-4-phosphate dehydrogenase
LSKSKSDRLRIAITPGEPAGIGPDICLTAFAEAQALADLIVIADPELLRGRAELLNLEIPLNNLVENSFKPDQLNIQPVELGAAVTPGEPVVENAGYVLDCLRAAVAGCQSGQYAAMVTGPVHKGIINDSGIPFSGHTEWLAEQTHTNRVVMMLATETLRVALATTHLPLQAVPAAITREMLKETIEILHSDLKSKFGLKAPHILVCGLNPHAGEGGHLGREEIEVIEPVIREMRSQGMEISGQLPADTAFTRRSLENKDAVLAMYHDQGLPVIKHSAFGEVVNITLGLPVIRTSVDHGTAFDLAGSGMANHDSLLAAIRSATSLARNF